MGQTSQRLRTLLASNGKRPLWSTRPSSLAGYQRYRNGRTCIFNGAKAVKDIHNGDFTFFWNGPFSQWHPSKFEVNYFDFGGMRYRGGKFCTAEQFMMFAKAILFEDLETAQDIMAVSDPKMQKAFGRRVRNFDANMWNAVARHVVYQGNLAKFQQNDKLRAALLATGDTTLVEASPYDTIWGIGLNEEDARITPVKDWKGTNWLGLELTEVRRWLRAYP